MVRPVLEEHLNYIRRKPKIVFAGIVANLTVHFGQSCRVGRIVGIGYYNLLLEHGTLYPESEYLHEEVAVEIEIEHDRVVVGLVCEEYCERRKHSRSDALTEPYCPHTASRHAVARILENIIHDEHQHGDNHRNAKSALTDDGTQGRTDKEEYQARKRQSKLVDGLYLVLSYKFVAVCRYHALKVEVVHFALHLAEGRINSLKLSVGRKSRIDRVEAVSLCPGHLDGSQRVFL